MIEDPERQLERLYSYSRQLREERLKSTDPIEREEDVIPSEKLPEYVMPHLPGGEHYDTRWNILEVSWADGGRKVWEIKQNENGLYHLESTPEAIEIANQKRQNTPKTYNS